MLKNRKQTGTVMVLDDNLVSLTVMQRILAASGYDVYVARSIWDAAHQLERQRVDVLVTDRVLERESFHQLHDVMTNFGRATAPYRKVIVVSATWTSADCEAFAKYEELVTELLVKGALGGPHLDRVMDTTTLVGAVQAALVQIMVETT